MKNAVLIILISSLTFVVNAQRKPAVAKKRPIAAVKTASADPAAPLDEKEQFQKASNLDLAADRVTALQKFIGDFPNSENVSAAKELISSSRVLIAEEKLLSGDPSGAATTYKLAIEEAPDPVSNDLYKESLAAIPMTLYWRGARAQALDIAGVLEKKVSANAGQLIELANFYISIENGAEALRVAQAAAAADANSEPAYRTIAIAHRLNFDLEESANAFARALQIDPNSLPSKRGLAEMRRALGRPDEAISLYREILDKNKDDLPARTGLVLSLFDAGKMAEADVELTKSLEQNPGNIILLAGAAYWYASQGYGARAVDLAQRAIAKEPRYIWSHIALARGLMAQKKPVDAEQALIKARQYGNFPMLEYEIASARAQAGFYRDAVEELRKSFAIADGKVQTRLGGRVSRSENGFSDLVAYERRASIFAPAGPDDTDTATQLKLLLDLDQKLNAATVDESAVSAAADEFTRGSDKMKLYRQLYAASALLQKKIALPKVLELSRAAAENSDAGLDVPNAGAAVMASELYDSRAIALSRGEFLLVPDVPRQTLSAILRGRIEELAGWALYQQGSFPEAVVRLRRAITVLPDKSAWWRSSMWRLGAALEAAGKEKEALDAYIQSYKTDKPDFAKYVVVEALYKKVNGSTDGLEAGIGANRMMASATSSEAATAMPARTESEQPPARQKAAETVIPKDVPVDRTAPSGMSVQPETPKLQADVSKASADAPAPKIATISDAPDKPPADAKTETASKAVTGPTPAATPAAVPSDIEAAKQSVAETDIKPAAAPKTAERNRETPAVETGKQPTIDTKAEGQPKSDATEPPKSAPANSDAVKPEPATTEPATAEPTKAEPTKAEPTVIEPVKPQPVEEKPVEKPSNKIEASEPEPVPETVFPAKEPEKKDDVPEENDAKDPVSTKKLVVVTDKLPPPVDLTRKPKLAARRTALRTVAADESLFKPVIITIPDAAAKEAAKSAEGGSVTTNQRAADKSGDLALSSGAGRMRVIAGKEIKGDQLATCSISSSEDSVSVTSNGGTVGILVGIDGEGDIRDVTAKSNSPNDIQVTREPEIAGLAARRFFVIKSISAATGIYQVKLEARCGRKEVLVSVR